MATPYNIFGAVGLTGTSLATLDKISSDVISHNDFAIVSNNNLIYFYKLDAYSGITHSEPFVIKPNDITEESIPEIKNKRWILISQNYYNSDLTLPATKLFRVSKIRANSNNPISITASDGKVITIHTDGETSFPSTISISDPTLNEHATTKFYVDTEISELKDYTDNEIETNINELKDYTDNEISELKDYTDNELDTHKNDITVHFTIYTEILNTWYANGPSYFNDIIHNKNRDIVFSEFYFNNEKIIPEKIEKINNNTLRIWMPTQMNGMKAILI